MNHPTSSAPLNDAARSAASHLWLILILGLSAFLNFLALGRQSFWLDEIYSYYFATLPNGEFWKIMANGDANMVLYYTMLRAWILAADTEFWIRSLSALMALAAVAGVYVLTTRLFGRRAGLIAAFLLAINPFVVAYAQEARAYALFLFLSVCATALFIRAMERSRITDWAAYVLVASLSVYSHLFAALVVFSHGVSLLLWPRSELPWRRLLVAAGGIGLLLSPMVAVVITSEGKLPGWVSEPGLRQLVGVFASLAGNKWLVVPYAALSLIAVLAAGRERAATTGRLWYCGVLTAVLVVPVAISFAASLVEPVFVDRYLISGVAPLVILVASGLDRIRSMPIMVVVLAAIVGLTIPRLISHFGSEKENWRGVTAHLTAHARENDAVVFYTATGQHAFAYYRKQQRSRTPAPTVTVPPRAARAAGGLELRRVFVQDLARRHQRVWLVFSHVNVGQRHIVSSSIEDVLGHSHRPATEWQFQGVQVRVYHAEASVAP